MGVLPRVSQKAELEAQGLCLLQWGMTSREAGVRGAVSKAGKEREPVQFIGNCDLRTKALIRFPTLPKLLHEIHTEYLKEAGPLEETSGFLINQN